MSVSVKGVRVHDGGGGGGYGGGGVDDGM